MKDVKEELERIFPGGDVAQNDQISKVHVRVITGQQLRFLADLSVQEEEVIIKRSGTGITVIVAHSDKRKADCV